MLSPAPSNTTRNGVHSHFKAIFKIIIFVSAMTTAINTKLLKLSPHTLNVLRLSNDSIKKIFSYVPCIVVKLPHPKFYTHLRFQHTMRLYKKPCQLHLWGSVKDAWRPRVTSPSDVSEWRTFPTSQQLDQNYNAESSSAFPLHYQHFAA